MIVFGIALIVFSVLYIKLLANLKLRNRILLSIFLVVSVLMLYLVTGNVITIIVALVVSVLFCCDVRFSRQMMYFSWLLICFLVGYPGWYQRMYPFNNLEEDLSWAVYDLESVTIIVLIALILTFLLYFLNRKWWKLDGLWACNLVVGFLFMYVGMDSVFDNIEHSEFLWLLALVVWGLINLNEIKDVSRSRVTYAVLALISIFVLTWASVPIVHWIKRPKIEEYQGKSFSYMAVVQKGYNYGIINEHGEEVIPCVFFDVDEIKMTEEGCFIQARTDYEEFLLNERGKIISTNPQEIEKIIEEKVIEDEQNSTSYEDELKKYSIVEENGQKGVVDEEGNCVLQVKYDGITFVGGKYFRVLDYGSASEEFKSALFDKRGKEVIPFGNYGIEEGGYKNWIKLISGEEIKYVDSELNTMLELQGRYDYAEPFVYIGD
ncbi:MAG: WG repeat-containing protein [Clostridia bacterium]|nr:WG repeat-containing protein [Clostridia bacterium]